ncbi:MAG TPA: ABC transporter ATP-binding protein [Candidatus Limnocylindrales bacterium]|nr:ABC transporter ATP-binding protein [Candidatus Limnocylindrales bacterium]
MTVAENASERRTAGAPASPPPGPAEGPPDVELLDVTKRFGSITAVDRMTLRIPRSSFTSLLGPSGCGKTTTLRMIAGFEQPTEGEILLTGRPIAGVPPYQRNVNTVFQHYALFPHMDVAQNVGYGLRQRKVPRLEERRRASEALELVRLSGYERRRTWELSGGQQQRVALARALVNHPSVLLLDEPLGALDLKLRKEMQLELKALQQEVGITFVYVTHDQEEALTMSDVIVVMRDGLIQQMGNPTELYEHPVNKFVANFIGTSNPLQGRVVEFDAATRRARVETDSGLSLNGTVTDPAAVPAAGTSVTVAVRPERLRVEPAGTDNASEGSGWTEVTGRIHQGTYLGDQTEYRITTDRAGELVARRQNALGAGTAQGLGPGDSVVVRWHEEANLILVG